MSIQSIEQFTTDNFEEEWEKLIAPPAAKDLKNFVEEFRKQNQTQNNSSQADFLKQFVEEFRRQSNNEAGGHGEHYQ
jgi:Sec-independent protein translocase protein TatA